MSEIKLYDNHLPSLESGTYKIEVKQTLAFDGNSLSLDLPERKDGSEKNLEFTVVGEHFAINPLHIDSVFPPAGSMGNFSQVLPHIILNRSTLPWENEAGDGKDSTPWFALLLFHEGEVGEVLNADSKAHPKFESQKSYLFHLQKTDFINGNFPSNPIEPTSKKENDTNEELVSVILAPKSLLIDNKEENQENNDKIPPFYSELSKLVHVRSTSEQNKDDTNYKSVVVCKRLPKKDKKNIVHLVSLEKCFDGSGNFDQKKIDGNHLALVSLKSWEFFCNDHFIISEELIESDHFDDDKKETLRKIKGKEYFEEDKFIEAFKTEAGLTSVDDSIRKTLISTFRIGHLPDILKHLNRTPSRLRLSDPGFKPGSKIDKDHLKILRAGYLNLPYQLKTGKKIDNDVCYRGPMLPKASDMPIAVKDFEPLLHSDTAFRYIPAVNKLDVSYAAAWELGKLLAIQNKNFSVALYKWKRACYQAIKLNNKKGSTDVLPDVPSNVKTWFDNVKVLKGIPFDYLIPDPELIPFESIRFFEIDETWLTYFIDGAFSIGRISKIEKAYEQELYSDEGLSFLKTSSTIRSGFLLHSVAVAGWPDLVIFENSGNPPAKNGPIGYEWLDLGDKTDHDFGDKWVDLAFGANDTFYYLNKVTGTVEFSNNNFGIDKKEDTNNYAAYYRYIPSRKEKLSPNLLICLFEGSIRNIAIHQKPESIHLSVKEGYTSPDLSKYLKNNKGKSSRDIANELMENSNVKVIQFEVNSKVV